MKLLKHTSIANYVLSGDISLIYEAPIVLILLATVQSDGLWVPYGSQMRGVACEI